MKFSSSDHHIEKKHLIVKRSNSESQVPFLESFGGNVPPDCGEKFICPTFLLGQLPVDVVPKPSRQDAPHNCRVIRIWQFLVCKVNPAQFLNGFLPFLDASGYVLFLCGLRRSQYHLPEFGESHVSLFPIPLMESSICLHALPLVYSFLPGEVLPLSSSQ